MQQRDCLVFLRGCFQLSTITYVCVFSQRGLGLIFPASFCSSSSSSSTSSSTVVAVVVVVAAVGCARSLEFDAAFVNISRLD